MAGKKKVEEVIDKLLKDVELERIRKELEAVRESGMMLEFALYQFERYKAFRDAGFSEMQAMHLITRAPSKTGEDNAA